jgi:ankyrin repeat protein
VRRPIIIFTFSIFSIFQNSYAQSINLSQSEFWKSKPSMQLIKDELRKGFDFEKATDSEDPLMLAINNNADFEIIKFLTEQKGADFTRKFHDARNYLHTSVGKNMVAVSELLIAKGVDMNALDKHGSDPLVFAASNGNLKLESLQLFERNGYDVYKKHSRKDDADLLLLAIANDKDLSITKYLLSKGATLSAVDKNGNNAFYYAARVGNKEVLNFLLNNQVEAQDNALFSAAIGTRFSSAKLEVFQYLIEDLKLNPILKDKDGLSLINYVTRKPNQDELLIYLLKHNIPNDIADRDGNTPFMNAAKGKSIKALELLFTDKTNVNLVNKKGETALFNALKNGSADVVKYLLSKGADINVLDKDGNGVGFYLIDGFRSPGNKTGAYDEVYNDLQSKMELVKAANYDFNSKFANSENMLTLAAIKDDVRLFEILMHYKINMNHMNEEGLTVLHKVALNTKTDKVLRYLIENNADRNIKTEMDETAYELALDNEVLKANNINFDFLK